MSWGDHFPEGPSGIKAYVRRGTLVETDDSGSQQLIKVRGLASEQLDKIVRLMPHGIASHAPKDSEGVFLALGGRSDRVMALGFEHKDKRPKDLPEGAARLYDSSGNIVYVALKDGIQIEAKSGKVYVKPADGEFVYLGGNGKDGQYALVSTVLGPAKNVKARIA